MQPIDTIKQSIKGLSRILYAKQLQTVALYLSSWSYTLPPTNSSGLPENKTIFDALSTIIFGSLSNSHENTFNVTRYGTYTANFFTFPPIIQALSPFLSIGTLILVIVLDFHNTNLWYKE